MSTISSDLSSRLERLDWECEHFGFPVVRLDGDTASDVDLRLALDEARRTGIALVVLHAKAQRKLDELVLADFNGRLVDEKATFARTLSANPYDGRFFDVPQDSVSEYLESCASAALVELAIAAGALSRFRTDARFPHDKFVSMYRMWIERSVRREIADVVLVDRDASGELLGFVTARISNGTGKIGLIAVAECARGQGVGRRLMSAVHHWMHERKASDAQVVTQLCNTAACALYRSAGYSLDRVEHYYHVWPLASGVPS